MSAERSLVTYTGFPDEIGLRETIGVLVDSLTNGQPISLHVEMCAYVDSKTFQNWRSTTPTIFVGYEVDKDLIVPSMVSVIDLAKLENLDDNEQIADAFTGELGRALQEVSLVPAA